MKLLGKTTHGATAIELAANTKRVAPALTSVAVRVVKLTAWLDGLGSGIGNQAVRGVIYDSTGNLLALGEEVIVADGQSVGLVDLPFAAYPEGVPLGLDFDLGLLAGPAGNTVRVYGDDQGVVSSKWNADTYADGASAAFGASTTSNFDLTIFATYVSAWSPPTEDEYDLAQYPFDVAQATLGATGPVASTAVQAAAGWHGTKLDDGVGAFVVVDPDGPCADFVGKRVQVTLNEGTQARRVWAFCHRASPLDPGDDLSLTRRLFAQLAPLKRYSAQVVVEELA